VTVDDLRRRALLLPGTAEGVACAGTTLECRTITAAGKTFVFLPDTEIRLKLRDSLPEAEALAAAEPATYHIGAHGWVTIRLPAGEPVAKEGLDRLEQWLVESFLLIAPKKLARRLSAPD
jgi:hypothetical protein